MRMKEIAIMKRTNIILILLLLLVLVSCGRQQPSEETLGMMKLDGARALYAQGNYAAARDAILSLRKNHPTALEARRQAILLLDSVELQLAEGDSLKQEFFRRKLLHDIQEIGGLED